MAVSTGAGVSIIPASGSGGTIASTTNLLIGDGAGNASAAGAGVISSTSAAALSVGANGATNPVLAVDASTASVVGGVAIKGAATGGITTITATDSGSNQSLTISSKGTGNMFINGGNTVAMQCSGSSQVSASQNSIILTNTLRTFTSNTGLSYTLSSSTSLTASTEVFGVLLDLSATQQHSTGALTTQRDLRIRPSTHSFVAASTLTDAYGVYLDGAPIAGTNATVTRSTTLFLGGNAVGAGTGTSYGLQVNPNTGAAINYGIFGFGKTGFDATNTAGGTTGAQTINKPSGTVNFAAAATSLVVTNSLCTTASIVFAVVRTNDTTAVIKNVVPAAGSFTITLNAAATAETSVGFFIIN